MVIESRGWTVRAQPPSTPDGARLMLLLHGWTGDERVMWVFTGGLPRHYAFIAPRAPLPAAEGGFAWLPHAGRFPRLDDFAAPAASLLIELPLWIEAAGLPAALASQPFDLMGFSQGAAMSYALAALNPDQVERVIALAGFLPVEEPLPGRFDALRGKPVYIAHGTQDAIVPVDRARQASQALETAGARVIYCESDVGHKLSAGCLKGLREFLAS
jgi:phospholipase/carboxylesterase